MKALRVGKTSLAAFEQLETVMKAKPAAWTDHGYAVTARGLSSPGEAK